MQRIRETLGGRYELVDVLGRGGMGVVYRARDQVLEREVAVKLLSAALAEDPMFVARFEREARAAAALSHPNVVGVFDTGWDGERQFIVMEYLPGTNLAVRLRESGRLSPTRAAAIGAPIAAAMAAAHGKEIIHRDIKPGNVMVADGGEVKVLDFGIARAVAGTSLTQTEMVLGSSPYLAPELARGEPADERSDIYSLGCVMYEMVTGGPPFTGDLPAAIMHQHNSVPPRPPRELEPGTPPALDALVMRMLAKRPRDRPQRAQLLVREIPAAARDSSRAQAATRAHAATRRMTVAPGVRSATRRFAGAAGPTRPAAPRRYAIALALVGAVALILALVLSSSGPQRHRVDRARRTVTSPSRSTASTPVGSTTTAPTRPTTTAASTEGSSHPATLPSVGGAASELTVLATQDLQPGTIDQQASQQIRNHLQDILNAYSQGHTADALNKIGDLNQQIADLASHGDVQSSALAAITTAMTSLSSALSRAAPVTAGGASPVGPAAQGSGQGPESPNHPGPKPLKPPHH